MQYLHSITKIFMMLGIAMMCWQCRSTISANNETVSQPKADIAVPEFNADSAYRYVSAQCAFGARVPNTAAHKQCADYLESQLQRYGVVTTQSPVLTMSDGTKLNDVRNIICAINPDSSRRVLLLAHWDSRPWADEDADKSLHTSPVLGANDGASGVGVLLELARIFSATPPKVGVDILLVDAEDAGNDSSEDSWALGTQYWAGNPHRKGYRPIFGILLDMVGDANAIFPYEAYSTYYASQVQQLVWDTAIGLGHGKYFKKNSGGAVTDDHVYVNRAGIPTIDIIDSRNDGFCPQWHTTHDTLDKISTATLKAVGETVATVVYSL